MPGKWNEGKWFSGTAACMPGKWNEGKWFWGTVACVPTALSNHVSVVVCRSYPWIRKGTIRYNKPARNAKISQEGIVREGNLPFETVATFECDEGYHISGAESAICLFSQEWSRPAPTCSISTKLDI